MNISIIDEIVKSPRRDKLIIMAEREGDSLRILTGSFKVFNVPLSSFQPSGTISPDFDNIDIIDGGNTLKLGDYEAASDCIIEEVSSVQPQDFYFPDWRTSSRTKCHEWKNYISDAVMRLWNTFNLEQRLAIAQQALDQANQEDWE